MDRLSPNMAPPTTAPMSSAASMPVWAATPAAMGPTAAMVPMEVPMAVATKDEMTNSPGSTSRCGTNDSPRFTVDSTPPMSEATEAKPPASR